MTITLGSKGKGRDLEMGWWQYLSLGERSQRCVTVFMGVLLRLNGMQASCLVGIVNDIYGTSYETVHRWTAVPLPQVLRTSFAQDHCPGH